jgi:hypothetical protein
VEFRPNTTVDEDGNQGKRTDGADLIQSWQSDKTARNVTFKYVWNREQLLSLDPATTEYTFGE